jgi:hypothetical protein
MTCSLRHTGSAPFLADRIGELKSFDDLKLLSVTVEVKSADGTELKIVLADSAVAVRVVKAALADIKPGSFVGIAAMPQSDGAQRALEVLIFPDAMRGTGEGQKDIIHGIFQPKSTMTNASVEQVVTAANGPTLMVEY